MKDPALFLICVGLAFGWLSFLLPGSGVVVCRVAAVVAFVVAAVYAAGVLP